MTALPINVRRVAKMIGIIALVFIVLEFNRRLEELKLLSRQHEIVQTQATQAVQTQMALETQVAYAGSDAAVEEWARTDGHYVQEGDLPIVPIAQPGSAPVELSTPVPSPTPMTHVQTWWDLFFGEH
jgi:cell division protein FtsB